MTTLRKHVKTNASPPAATSSFFKLKSVPVPLPLFIFFLVSTTLFWVQTLRQEVSTLDLIKAHALQTFEVGKASLSSTTGDDSTTTKGNDDQDDGSNYIEIGSLIPIYNDFAPPSTYYGHATNPDEVWESLLKEGSELRKLGSDVEDAIVVEVGMHRLFQCRMAAEQGFHAHCLEPSPANYKRVYGTYRGLSSSNSTIPTRDRIHLYNVAAGRESNQTIHFLSSGSTGDKVLTQEQAQNSSAKQYIVKVPTMTLDDVVEPFKSVFLAKIDTQGFEPSVLAGLEKSIAMQKVDYLLMEYWPRGMDDLSPPGSPRCKAPIRMLQKLAQAGYTLYQLKIEWHPKEPMQTTDRKTRNTLVIERPFDNIVNNCNWFFELEEKVPIKIMGYWSDVLAVSPKSRLPDVPLTRIGKILLAGRNKYQNTSKVRR